MVAVRLLLGLLKGIVVGGLVGWGLAAAGIVAPSALIAYPIAALVGVLVALVAGKPVWAEDSKIQIYLKMGAGALLGPGLLFLVRSFLTMAVPFAPSVLPGVTAGSTALGMFAVTSLAIVGAVLAAFYDADNSGALAKKKAAGTDKKKAKASGGKKRISADLAAITGLDAAEIEAIEAEREQSSRE